MVPWPTDLTKNERSKLLTQVVTPYTTNSNLGTHVYELPPSPAEGPPPPPTKFISGALGKRYMREVRDVLTRIEKAADGLLQSPTAMCDALEEEDNCKFMQVWCAKPKPDWPQLDLTIQKWCERLSSLKPGLVLRCGCEWMPDVLLMHRRIATDIAYRRGILLAEGRGAPEKPDRRIDTLDRCLAFSEEKLLGLHQKFAPLITTLKHTTFAKLALILESNKSPAYQLPWRKSPYDERVYDKITSFEVCDGLPASDVGAAENEMRTNLATGFWNNLKLESEASTSEGWMNHINKFDNDNEGVEISSDAAVIRTQVSGLVNWMVVQTEERILNASGVLSAPEITSSTSGMHEVWERPVWGIDCWTRNNIERVLEGEEKAEEFMQDWFLRAVNLVDSTKGYSFKAVVAFLDLEGEPLLGARPEWVLRCVDKLKNAFKILGETSFMIHPKGHGAVCLQPVKANRMVTFYRGELYPSWRWSEKNIGIEAVKKAVKSEDGLPDFYNMTLERPRNDPRGFGLLFVDASRKSSMGSSLSHSCLPSCEVKVVSHNSNLSLAMTTLRDLEVGEELTFDYSATTDSLKEFQAAICLCGSKRCRGSFLHFAKADMYQKVFNLTNSCSTRFATLIKACMKPKPNDSDVDTLNRHGFITAAFGALSYYENQNSQKYVPVWLRCYVADILRYIEYERKSLPVSLICDSREKNREDKKVPILPYDVADVEGRNAMDRRVIDCTQTLNLVGRVLARERETKGGIKKVRRREGQGAKWRAEKLQ